MGRLFVALLSYLFFCPDFIKQDVVHDRLLRFRQTARLVNLAPVVHQMSLESIIVLNRRLKIFITGTRWQTR